MSSNGGLPTEILILCTAAETKERALQLLDYLRTSPHAEQAIVWKPAIPAACSLIASEQLGNTTVTERRALQWSQSTPEQFKATVMEVQKALASSKYLEYQLEPKVNLQKLADEFCLESHTVERMLPIEHAYKGGDLEWPVYSILVQVTMFIWCCRRFRIPTIKSLDSLRQRHNLHSTSEETICKFLDAHFLPTPALSDKEATHSQGARNSLYPLMASSDSRLPQHGVDDGGDNDAKSNMNGSIDSQSVTLDELVREFDLGEEVSKGLRFFDGTIRGMEEFKDLVDWDSTMGRCTLFYWTCSILKIPAAKHITLRQKYDLGKREFDKIIWSLDSQRETLRKSLEEVYAANPALDLLPQGVKWAATSTANVSYASRVPGSSSSVKTTATRGDGRKRGRAPREKDQENSPLHPISAQERKLKGLCSGNTLNRALILMRSFYRRYENEDPVPSDALPSLVTLLACEQLRDSTWNDKESIVASGLTSSKFYSALEQVKSVIKDYWKEECVEDESMFDELALEFGLDINTVFSMAQVRRTLMDSRCLSDSMDWKSSLVRCAVFFWTSAVLKVPNIKQTSFRTRSLAAKREFDSMLQLLNNHCAGTRQRLEAEQRAKEIMVYAPPPLQDFTRNNAIGNAMGTAKRQKRRAPDPKAAISKRIKWESQSPSESESARIGDDEVTVPEQRRSPSSTSKSVLYNHNNGTLSKDSTNDTSARGNRSQFPVGTLVADETIGGFSNRRGQTFSPKGKGAHRDLGREGRKFFQLNPGYSEKEDQYRMWEQKMAEEYGREWEKTILREDGVAFE